MGSYSETGFLESFKGALWIGFSYFSYPLTFFRQRTWGATKAEISLGLPGDNLSQNLASQATRSITLKGSPEENFGWIRQIGCDRGGFYSYSDLENLSGAKIRNAIKIRPEWQNLSQGDQVLLHPCGEALEVESVIENQTIVLSYQRELLFGQGIWFTWSFNLFESRENTRLVIRSRGGPLKTSSFANLVWCLIFDPGHFAMERKMILGLQVRSEKR